VHEYPHEDGDVHAHAHDDEAVFVPGLRVVIEPLDVLDPEPPAEPGAWRSS